MLPGIIRSVSNSSYIGKSKVLATIVPLPEKPDTIKLASLVMPVPDKITAIPYIDATVGAKRFAVISVGISGQSKV